VDDELAVFLARYIPQTEESAVWGSDEYPLPLRIRAYLTVELPPLAYITSVRSLIFRDGDDALLVLRNRDSTHIVPGGRREPHETLRDTLQREVLEETGWTLRDPTVLGFMHFHYMGSKPPCLPYPHPDFVQIVYMAWADTYEAGARAPDDYEIEASFRPLAMAHELALTPGEQLYLAAALKVRGGPQLEE
jgi:8-oxo-dGTP pyrophosphatase MutT (NUDIX family)